MTYNKGQPITKSIWFKGQGLFPHSGEAPGSIVKTRTKQLKEEKPMSSNNGKLALPTPH